MHTRSDSRRSRVAALAVALAVAVGLAGCSVNPATGKRQLALVSEEQEIAMGREADRQIPQQLGLYDDDDIQAYVAELGAELAAESERPDLPWTFRVVDDEVVNAFALPGGFIYVTRGILSHLSGEAELAGVLGHEIGHVTARHSVNRMSKGMLAQLGLGVGAVLSPEFANFAGLAQTGIGLLFLKYGRDDERQADELAFRYTARSGYDPRAMVDVFDLLARVSDRAGGGDLPGWVLTHPQPESRRQEAEKVLASIDVDPGALENDRDAYLRRLDGMIYGSDPRQGYFRDQRFLHPDLRFELRFPEGWQAMNMRQAVVAQQPDGEAVIALTLAAEGDAEAAARTFAGQGVTPVREWRDRINGQRAISYYFGATLEGTPIGGLAAFVEHDDRVYRLLAYASEARFDAYRSELEEALTSFQRVEDRRVLAVEPRRIEIERLDRETTIERIWNSYPAPISVEDLALLNNVEPAERLEPGTWIKRVVGERLPG